MLQQLQGIEEWIYMNRIERAFQKGKVLIPFITGGDPHIEVTYELIKTMAENGADMIELGIPFSDPVAEGVAVQEADLRALAAKTTTDSIFDMVNRLRKEIEIPIVLLTYMNPIYVYGTERFMKRCADVGVDGVMVPDVPYEEKRELENDCKENGVALISMTSLTTKDRIGMIAEEAEGYVYCISSIGELQDVAQVKNDIVDMAQLVNAATEIPVVVGFDGGNVENAIEIAKVSDGMVLENGIVSLVGQYGKESAPYVADFVRRIKNGMSN